MQDGPLRLELATEFIAGKICSEATRMQEVAQHQNPLEQFVRSDIPGRFSESWILKNHWPRLYNAFKGVVLPPFEILIHPSSACNLCCSWCIGDHVPIESVNSDGIPIFIDAAKTSHSRLPDNMANPEKMMRMIDGILDYKKIGEWEEDGLIRSAEFSVENVQFSGLIGEPLAIRKALVPAMRRLVDSGKRVGMFTNGILMDEFVRETVAHIAYINLSLDAGEAETYSLLKFGGRRGGLSHLGSALDNTKKLISYRDEVGGTVEVNSSFILYPENYREVYKAAQILKDIGVRNLKLKRDISGSRLLTAEQMKEANELVNKAIEDFGGDDFRIITIHTLEENPDLTRQFSTCYVTDLMAAIGSDGNLYPCNYHPRPGGYHYGSAIDNTFQAVWEGKQRERIKGSIPSICPAVCDPFKNRSNSLLYAASGIMEHDGLQALDMYRGSISIPT